MKVAFLSICLVLLMVQDNAPPVNSNYRFPEELKGEAGKDYAQQLATSGFYMLSRQNEDSLYGPLKPVYTTLQNKKKVDAREFLLQEARKYRVLLINEAHNRPEHRLFTKSLLKELYNDGYRVFLAEGIWGNSMIGTRSYPISQDGFYINEPNYASLIRYAKGLGYSTGAYEFTMDDNYWDDTIRLDQYGSVKYIKENPKDSAILKFDAKGLVSAKYTSVRERVQAENILRIMKENKGAKVVVHVGYGHLYEDGPLMGAKLKTLLKNEDILTIDQVSLDDRRSVIDTISGKKITGSVPYFLLDTLNGNMFHFPGVPVDFTVFRPEVKDSLSRPSFLFTDPQKRFVYNLPDTVLKDCPCLFSAYYLSEYKKEYSKSIAVDIVYVKDKMHTEPLLLYKGNYIVWRQNRLGKFEKFEIKIK
jgi:hypothetical protein